MSTLKANYLQHPSSTTANLTLNSDGSVSGGLPTAGRNLIYNGAMQVAQYATSSTAVTTAKPIAADRWGVYADLAATLSVATDAPSGSGFRNSLKFLHTAAGATPTAGQTASVFQKLEGQDLQRIAKGTASAQQLTLSFWVKSNKTGTYVAELYDYDNTRMVNAQYTVSAADTWEKKSITFPADTTGAFDNDNAASLMLEFFLYAGTTYSGGSIQSTWAAVTTANRAAGQVNLAAATNNYWQVTGVQLEVGPVATPFEFEDYGTTLRKCQRYFRRYTSSMNSGYYAGWGAGWVSNTTDVTAVFLWGTTFRSAPSVKFSSQTDFYVDRAVGGGASTVVATSGVSDTGMRFYATGPSGGSIGQGGAILSNNAATPYIEASAEL